MHVLGRRCSEAAIIIYEYSHEVLLNHFSDIILDNPRQIIQMPWYLDTRFYTGYVKNGTTLC